MLTKLIKSMWPSKAPSAAAVRFSDIVRRREREVLDECDKKLEALQDEMRGETKVRPIRKLIEKRINAINHEIEW